MTNPVLERLTKQRDQLEQKGAMRSKHESRTLANLDVKIKTIKSALDNKHVD